MFGIPVAWVEDAVGTRPKYGAQVGFLVAAQSCDERAHRFLGGYEAALRLRRVQGCACATPTQRIAARICRSQLFGNRIKAS